MRAFSVNKHVVMTITLVVVVLFAWWLGPHHEIMRLWIQRAGWWGPLLAIALYVLLSLTPIPSDPLTIVAVVLYGPWVGFFISWIGNNAAGFVEYSIAKNVETALNVDYHKLPDWISRFPVNSAWFLIGIRFVPAVGGKVVAIMAGMYKVSWRRFIWTTMVANLIGSALWVLGGVGLIKTL
jgi:uncharacterized membrane protein YdjX (TVP38/TMEM64 family)